MSSFLPVPEYVIGRSDVTWGAKVCLGLLYKHERSRRKEWPCVGEIVEGMRQPRRTVERWLSELVGAGLATSERDGRETRYAPAVAVDGGRRDLSPHPPEMADVEPAGHPPQVADVTTEHPPYVADVSAGSPPQVADVGDSHLLTGIRDLRGGEAPGALGLVEAAYASALGEKRGKYIPNLHRDNPHWRSAKAACEALAEPGEVLRDASLRLARAYVSERRSRSPEWFAEWLQKRAASGDSRAIGGRVEPLPNAAYRGTPQAEIDAMFGEVTEADYARIDGKRRAHG